MLLCVQSQKPKLRALQRHLFFQLKTEQMPKDKQGSAEEQLQHLVNICANKNLLIIIDECVYESHFTYLCPKLIVFCSCWDAAHHKLLDVTDKQTESRILLVITCNPSMCVHVFMSYYFSRLE